MEEKCLECGMPINEETACQCDPSLCYHCCACEENCECGCKLKK